MRRFFFSCSPLVLNDEIAELDQQHISRVRNSICRVIAVATVKQIKETSICLIGTRESYVQTIPNLDSVPIVCYLFWMVTTIFPDYNSSLSS